MRQPLVLAKVFRRLLRDSMYYETWRGSYFLTIKARPKASDQIGTGPAESPDYSTAAALKCEATAIVMQGPITVEDDFTAETLRIYATAMPNCRLILSTWSDTPADQLERMRALGVDVVLSERPAEPGMFNVNMQITTAAAGVRHAVENRATWVMKTRTDQRVYFPETMTALAAMAKSLPPSGEAAKTQRYRIIGVGQGTLKFAPYHMTDQTVFGHADDMLAYWTPELRSGPPPAHWPTSLERIFSEVPIGEECRYGAPESYLASQFLQRQGRPLEWTLADSWAAYRDHFCVVDYGSTDFYWQKAQYLTLREDVLNYRLMTNRKELMFLDWMQLHAGHLTPEHAAPYEKILAEPFTTFVPDFEWGPMRGSW